MVVVCVFALVVVYLCKRVCLCVCLCVMLCDCVCVCVLVYVGGLFMCLGMSMFV